MGLQIKEHICCPGLCRLCEQGPGAWPYLGKEFRVPVSFEIIGVFPGAQGKEDPLRFASAQQLQREATRHVADMGVIMLEESDELIAGLFAECHLNDAFHHGIRCGGYREGGNRKAELRHRPDRWPHCGWPA